MYDLGALFGPRTFLYGDEQAELEAVAAGRKALAWYPLSREQVEECNDLDEIVEAAKKLGLSTLIVPRHAELVHPKAPDRDVFVFAEPVPWRIEAFRTCRNVLGRYPWSDSSEYLCGEFLGYSRDDCERWLEECRHNRLGWRGQTALALLDDEQVDALRELSFRCFPTTFGTAELVVFGPADALVLRRNLKELVPDGRWLIRFALENEASIRVFSAADGAMGVRSAPLSMSPAELNASLESHIEVWTRDGWTCRLS